MYKYKYFIHSGFQHLSSMRFTILHVYFVTTTQRLIDLGREKVIFENIAQSSGGLFH